MCDLTIKCAISTENWRNVAAISPQADFWVDCSSKFSPRVRKFRANITRPHIAAHHLDYGIHLCLLSVISDPLLARIDSTSATLQGLMKPVQGFVLFSNSPFTSTLGIAISLRPSISINSSREPSKVQSALVTRTHEIILGFCYSTLCHASRFRRLQGNFPNVDANLLHSHMNQYSCRSGGPCAPARELSDDSEFPCRASSHRTMFYINSNRVLAQLYWCRHMKRTYDVVNENQQSTSVGENRWSSRVRQSLKFVKTQNPSLN